MVSEPKAIQADPRPDDDVDYRALWQRTQADFVNYKRRVENERKDFIKSANADLVCSLLPVLDDLDRALRIAPADEWAQGMELIGRKLHAILAAAGLETLGSVGEPFDPHRHEAVAFMGAADGVQEVSEVIAPGYSFGGKLLRPAAVCVIGRELPENDTKNTHIFEEDK